MKSPRPEQQERVATARIVAIIGACLAGSPGSAESQLVGQPVYYRPIHDPAPTYLLSANYGSVESVTELGVIGLRASVEGDRYRIAVGLARVNSTIESGNEAAEIEEEHAHPGFEASGAYAFFNPNTNVWLVDALVGVGTVALESGLGAEQTDWRQWDFPIGLALGPNLRTPLAFFSDLEPWVAARVHARRTSFSDANLDDAWRGAFGFSGGVRLRLPSGIGVQGAVDWLRVRDPLAPVSGWEFSWSAGAHIGF